MRKAAGAESLIFSRKARLMRTAFVGCSERQLRDPLLQRTGIEFHGVSAKPFFHATHQLVFALPLWAPDSAIGCRSLRLARQRPGT